MRRAAVVLLALLAMCGAVLLNSTSCRQLPSPGPLSQEHSRGGTGAELVRAASVERTARREPVPPGEASGIQVELQQGLTLAGRVLDEQGHPVQGIVITAEVFEAFPGRASGIWKSPDEVTEHRTDSQGCFEFKRLPPKLIRVSTDEYELVCDAEIFV